MCKWSNAHNSDNLKKKDLIAMFLSYLNLKNQA